MTVNKSIISHVTINMVLALFIITDLVVLV